MEMDRLEEEAQTDVDKEIEEEIEQARAADAAKAASPPPKRGSVLAAVSSKLSTFRLGASPEPAPGDDAAAVSRERYEKRLEDGIEASVECGRVVGGARYYSVRCRRAGFQPATVAHPLTAFRDCRAALRSAGQAELVRSDFPLPRSASLESLGSLFRGDDDARREADDQRRARALDVTRASGCQTRLSPPCLLQGPQFGTRSKGAMKGDVSKAYNSSKLARAAATLACTTTYALASAV